MDDENDAGIDLGGLDDLEGGTGAGVDPEVSPEEPSAPDTGDVEARDRDRSTAADVTADDHTPRPTDDEDSQAPIEDTDLEVPEVANEAPMTQPAPVTDVAVDITEEAPHEEPEQNGVTSVTSLLSSVLAPFGASDNHAPADSPLAWGLLAFARRQLGQRSEQTGDGLHMAAALDTAAAVDPNAAPTGRAWVFSPGWLTGRVFGLVFGSDSDRDRLTYTGSTSTGKGTVVVNPRGSFTYTPTEAARHAAAKSDATDDDRTDSFVITIDDGNGHLTEVQINVEIRPANKRPDASGSVGLPNMDTGAVTGVVVTDDSDGDTLTYRVSTSGKGSVVVNDDGTFVYTPTEAAREAAGNRSFWSFGARRDTFTVTVDDGHGGTDTVRFTVQIAAIDNEAPEFDDVEQRDPGIWTGRVSGRVFATDADGDWLTYSGSTVTDKGRVTVYSSGRFVYTPTSDARHAAAAVGATAADMVDTFAVTVTDGFGGSLVVPVTVNIAPRNVDPRITRAGATRPDDDGVVTVTVSARDSDGDELTFTAPASTAKGTLVNNGDGTFTYTPTAAARQAAGADGATPADRTDTLTVTVTDGHGGKDTATVTVQIAPSTSTNADPTDGSFSVDAPGVDGVVTGTVTAIDPDENALSYSGSGTTSKGSVVVDPDGSFTYSPTPEARHAAAAVGAPASALTDSFTVMVDDGLGGTLAVPVTVTIVGANTPPDASFSAGSPDPETGIVAGIVTATDADGDTRTYSAPALSAKGGEITLNTTTGQFSYKPTDVARAQAAQTPGTDTDTFTVTVTDGHGGTDTVTVSVTVAPPVVTTAETAPGAPAGSVVVASDGTRYQVTSDYDDQTGLPTAITRVSVLDEDGRVIATSDDIPGGVLGASSAVARPDGSLLLVTTDTTTNISYISVVNAQGVVTDAGTASGMAAGAISLAANGTAFFTTVEIETDDEGNLVAFSYRLVRVSAANSTQTYDVDGSTAGTPVVTPDGSAYLVRYGTSAILAIDPDGTATSHFEQPITMATQPVLASDGNVYVAVTTASGQASNVTDILMFTGSTLTVRQVPGVLGFGGAPITVGPDGSVHVVTGTQSQTGMQLFLSRVTSTAVRTTSFDGNLASFVRVAGDGTAYVQAQRFAGNGVVYELKIVDIDGSVISVAIPGQVAALQVNGGNLVVAPDGTAYVSYRSETGRYHVAVITRGGTITTRALPVEVTVDQPVSISPTGAAFQRVTRVDAETGQSFVSVVSVATGAVSDEIPGAGAATMGTDPIVFGPDGRGYVFAGQQDEDGGTITSVLVLRADGSTLETFSAAGSVVAGLEAGGLTGVQPRLVTFAPDGTAYVTISDGPEVTGGTSEVWAITGDGAGKVIEVASTRVALVSVGTDGTAYFSAGYVDEASGDVVTKVHAIGDFPVVGVPGFVVDDVDDETGAVTGHFKVFSPGGRPLSYQLDTVVDPEVGSLEVDSATGAWTFTPTQAAREAAYFTAGQDRLPFTVTVSDGSTAVSVAVSALISELAPYQAPVVDEAEPYTVAPGGPDPATGAIVGQVNVTDDEVLTYYVVTQPDPALGTLELNAQTGQWTFTPTARTRVLAHALGQQSVEVTFAVAATDGTTATAPIVVTEPITGSPVAAVPLPSGEIPLQSFIDPDTGDGYFFTYDEEQQVSHLAVIIARDGSYRMPASAPVSGAVFGTLTVGETTYVVSVTLGAERQTYLARLDADGLIPIAGAIAGDPFDITDIYNLKLRHFASGSTTYLVSQSGEAGSGTEQIHLTAITTNGIGSTTTVPGHFQDVITSGDNTFVVSWTSDHEFNYETHVTLVEPNGVTPAMVPMPGGLFDDPVVLGGNTYVLTESYSDVTTHHVSALTASGTVYVGGSPGRLIGDPFVIGGNPYFFSQTDSGDPLYISQIHLSTFGPTPGSMTYVGDPVAGYLGEDAGPFVIGDDTYVVMRVFDATLGDQTQLMTVGAEGLTPVGGGIAVGGGSLIMLDGNPYVATWTDNPTGYQVQLLAIGPGGLTPVGDPVALPEADTVWDARTILIGDTTYLGIEASAPGAGSQIHFVRVGAEELTRVGSPVPGYFENVVDPVVVGDTAYVVTVTGDDESGYQTHLTAVGPAGVTPVDVDIPGQVIETFGGYPGVTIGETTYLVTARDGSFVGDQQFYLTEIGPGGVIPPGAARAGLPGGEPLTIDGKTYLVSDVYVEVPQQDYWTLGQTYLTVLDPDSGAPAVTYSIVGGMSRTPVRIGDTTYLVSSSTDGDPASMEETRTHLWAMTEDGPVPVAQPFPWAAQGLDNGVILIGDTTYVMTGAGLWAVDLGTIQSGQEV
ncbi:VCBS domain-containing protein [Mycobacterium sp. NAZ190054]|uniref:Ig-like domain-containing protein n=1 Tax=Mycobacterium sp. NAZ190054 TaxID=1747766 RepID=UPI000793EE08|nr:VCBS domain-containing protein [Mycobacterium sp. NAZ190054]KWX60303.1 hypothetical protein ASJ79_01330 [Mycobacterium sp. NAZ190054]